MNVIRNFRNADSDDCYYYFYCYLLFLFDWFVFCNILRLGCRTEVFLVRTLNIAGASFQLLLLLRCCCESSEFHVDDELSMKCVWCLSSVWATFRRWPSTCYPTSGMKSWTVRIHSACMERLPRRMLLSFGRCGVATTRVLCRETSRFSFTSFRQIVSVWSLPCFSDWTRSSNSYHEHMHIWCIW